MINCNGEINVGVCQRSIQDAMELYDNLPAEYRKLLQDAPFNLIIADIAPIVAAGGTIADVADAFDRIKFESTYLTYGPTHPDVSEYFA
jgi:hypothetical protein